jgi:tripartite-type tricarboxylate transporter receptor subunit TctC
MPRGGNYILGFLMKISVVVARALATGVALVFAGAAAAQQTFPSKPIRIIVPFSPGGTNDILARLLAPKLTESLGQQVIVDNRPGGNTVIASDALLKSAPDGHTLSLPGNSHVLTPYLSSTPLPFDVIKDFAPVASLARTGLFLVINPAVPANNLQEFIAYAKSKPGEVNSAAPGGSLNQLATEVFNRLAGVKLQHIPYKGSGPAMADVVGGQAQLSFQTPASALGHLKSGRLRAIAITGDTPYADPTFAQAGLKGFDIILTFGLLAPGGTPKPVIDRLNAEVAKILAMPDFREKVAAQGLETFVSTPEQYAAHLRSESEKFARVVKAAGIKPE